MNATRPIPKAINRCVRVHADNVFLLGDLEIPEESTSLVLFAFGTGRSRCNPRCQHSARVLHDYGIGTLVCDLLTEEEEIEDEATKKYCQNANLLAKRLIALTKWVASEPEISDLPIGYFGASAGGAAALIAAAKLKDRIGAIVSRGGRTDLASSSLRRVTSPTLLIVGENDTLGLEVNREAFKRLQCPKELHEVPGATHLFGEPGKLETMTQIGSDWLRRYLGAPPLIKSTSTKRRLQH